MRNWSETQLIAERGRLVIHRECIHFVHRIPSRPLTPYGLTALLCFRPMQTFELDAKRSGLTPA